MQGWPIAFFVVFGVHQCSPDCPSTCNCLTTSGTVECVSQGLRAVPDGIPGYTVQLTIAGNLIQRLGHGSFQGMDNITSLNLSSNGIQEIASRTFSSLTMMRSLNLNDNQLTLIHPEAFMVPTSPLVDLSLSNTLYNHTSLTDLITALRWGGLGSLRRLDLSGNGLIILPPGMFSPLPNLRQLKLRNNSLIAVYNGTFSGAEHLEELDLTENRFTDFSPEALRELERFSRGRLLLGYNPYHCSCGTERLASWVNTSRRVGDSEKLRCASPENLQLVAVQILTKRLLGCDRKDGLLLEDVDDLSLQTSYVFLGLVCGMVGMVFCFVLYLNRNGIRKWYLETRGACHDMMQGYQYRYEIDSDPRLGHAVSNGNREQTRNFPTARHVPTKSSLTQIPADVAV